MPVLRHMAVVLALLAAAGCISPYKTDVQQGNVITPEMVEKLKPGMTKSQVRFVLGTPLIADPFHPERWDYIYLYKKHARAPAETRQFTVIFDGDALARVEGEMTLSPGATAADGSSGLDGTNASNAPSPARAL